MDTALANTLKKRALSCLGEYTYNIEGQDTPSVSVNEHYAPTLREFLSAHRWTWAIEEGDIIPADALIIYQDAINGQKAAYVSGDFAGIPDNRPQAQQAFCFLLAARCAASAIGRHDLTAGLLQQYQRSLNDARYPDSWEMCQQGKGAIHA